jgi:hypothetical protein
MSDSFSSYAISIGGVNVLPVAQGQQKIWQKIWGQVFQYKI